MTSQAQKIHEQINAKGTQLGDLRKMAKQIKKDHELAMELWSTGAFYSRLLAILIMDQKWLNQEIIDQLDKEMRSHDYKERNQLADWLMANQLTKDKATLALINAWKDSPSPLQRRIFWYYQARLRWKGQTPPDNTDYLLATIEKSIEQEEPEVQWAMNLVAGWIGVYDQPYRNRCIQLGEKTGLYKDEMVAPNCTPSYLPKFIEIEVRKRPELKVTKIKPATK